MSLFLSSTGPDIYFTPSTSDTIVTISSDTPTISTFSVLDTPASKLVSTFISAPSYTTKLPTFSLPLPRHLNLNYDSSVHDQITETIYNRIYEDWLYDDIVDVLRYLKVSGEKVEPVGSRSAKTSVHKDSYEVLRKKIKFIKHNILSRSRLHDLLAKTVVEANMNWWDLEKNAYLVKDVVRHYIKRKLKNY